MSRTRWRTTRPTTTSLPAPMTSMTVRDGGHRRHQAGRRSALQEPVRARPGVLDVRAPDRALDHLDREEVRRQAGRARRQPGRLPRRYNFGETAGVAGRALRGRAGAAPPGTYRNVNGTQALAYGLIAASVRSGLGLFLASYLITPAGAAARAVALPQVRRAHDPGRGRDRRRQHGARRRLLAAWRPPPRAGRAWT